MISFPSREAVRIVLGVQRAGDSLFDRSRIARFKYWHDAVRSPLAKDLARDSPFYSIRFVLCTRDLSARGRCFACRCDGVLERTEHGVPVVRLRIWRRLSCAAYSGTHHVRMLVPTE
jgi:hypothetical protein